MPDVLDLRDLSRTAAVVDGDIIDPTSADYSATRRMWNGAIDRHPAAILQCRQPADVVAAIELACKADVPLTIRGGGHGFSGLAICDGGVVVDLSPMKTIEVDLDARRVRAGAGVLGAEMDRATQEHGLATTLGTISHTGIAGLTLGGGMGWLMREHGLTCDNLVSAQTVMADGRTVIASSESDHDLFWALRGGGGQFGVVTEFEFDLHDVGPEVAVAQIAFPLERGAEPLLVARDIAAAGARARNMFIVSLELPDAPHMPDAVRNRRVLVVMATSTDPADHDCAWVDPLQSLGPAMVVKGTRPYVELQASFDAQNPHGTLAYCKGAFLGELSDAALEIFAAEAKTCPPSAVMYLQQMGGAVSDRAEGDTAFQGRGADYVLNVVTRWTTASEAAQSRAWSQAVTSAFADHALPTTPLNFEGDPVGLDRRIYGDAADRLAQVKSIADPTGLFGIIFPLDDGPTSPRAAR